MPSCVRSWRRKTRRWQRSELVCRHLSFSRERGEARVRAQGIRHGDEAQLGQHDDVVVVDARTTDRLDETVEAHLHLRCLLIHRAGVVDHEDDVDRRAAGLGHVVGTHALREAEVHPGPGIAAGRAALRVVAVREPVRIVVQPVTASRTGLARAPGIVLQPTRIAAPCGGFASTGRQ